MDKIHALEIFRDLIGNRLSICNRDKDKDDVIVEAYNFLHNMLLNEGTQDLAISDTLQEKLEAGELNEYHNNYEDSGYVIDLYIRKKDF